MTTTPTLYTPTAKEIVEGMRSLPNGECRELTEQEVERGLARVRAEAVAPVLALHTSHRWGDGAQTCDHCTDPEGIEQMPYPCPTVRAVSIEQETQP